MRARDVAMDVTLTQTMLVESTHSLTPGVKTWNHLALSVHNLLPTVDAQPTIGIVPDDHNRECVKGWRRDAAHGSISFAREFRVYASIDIAIPVSHRLRQVAERHSLKFMACDNLACQLLNGIGLEELAIIRDIGVV